MRFAPFLLTTCAAICLTWPLGALAAPPGDRGSGDQGDQSDQQPKKEHKGGEKPAEPATKGEPQGGRHEAPQGGPQGGAQGGPQGGPPGQAGGHGHGPSGAAAPGPAGPQHAPGGGQGRPSGQAIEQPAPPQPPQRTRGGQGGQGGQGGGPGAAGGENRRNVTGGAAGGAPPAQTYTRPAGPPATTFQGRQAGGGRGSQAPAPLTGWDRNARGPAQVELGQQWRSQHHGWDQSAPWRSNRNWWRGDSAFRQFSGPRIGFFFFPGFGYIAAPQQYRNHYWRAGDDLPRWFWRYRVSQYWRYGLPTPPDGCSWIWLDGDVALVDLSDGYIVDLVSNVW